MVFLDKEKEKINTLYSELQDLYKGKKILEGAMARNFYNRDSYSQLFIKLKKQCLKIQEKKKELRREKMAYEKSRKNIWGKF